MSTTLRYEIPRLFLAAGNADLLDRKVGSCSGLFSAIMDTFDRRLFRDENWAGGEIRLNEDERQDHDTPGAPVEIVTCSVTVVLCHKETPRWFVGRASDNDRQDAVKSALKIALDKYMKWRVDNYPTWLIKLRDQQSNQRFA